MQSIKFPCHFSFLARRAKGRINHRTTWVMWSVAVLFTVLAVAVPMLRTVSADGPTFDIIVPMAGTTVNYETAKAQFAISNLPSTINNSNWVVGIKWSTPLDRYGDSKRTGPGLRYTPDDDDTFDATFSNGTITANSVALKKMIPDSDYTLKVTLYEVHSSGTWLRRGEGSTTFRTKAGCRDAGDMADNSVGLKPSWFGLYFVRHVNVNELTIVVSANSAYAPENSGRCLYYNYNEDGGGNSGILTAYFHYMHGSSRRAVIRLTGLKPGTQYHFTVSVDDELSDGNVGFSGTTLGPKTGISGIDISDVTQSSADATATIRNASSDDKFVYMRIRTSPEGAEEEDKGFWIDQDSMSTNGSTAKFGLSSLSAGTRYEVEASVKADYSPEMSRTEFFVTLPGQPTIDEVTPGDGQLTVDWSAPAEAPAPLTGYSVKRQDYDEYTDYDTTPPPTSTVVHYDVGAEVTDYTIAGLTNGKEYVVWVTAKNESFDAFGGTSSDEDYGTPMGLPGAPRNLDVAEGNAKLTLTWEAPAPQDGVTVNGYKLEWKANTINDWDAQAGITKADVSGLTREIPGLSNGTTYDVRVRADNGVTSDSYAWANGSGTPVADPSVGSITVKERAQTSATLTVSIDNGKDTGHTVHLRYREEGTTPWINANDETSSNDSAEFVLGSLKAGTTYEVLAWLDDDSAPPASVAEEFYTLPTVAGITFSDRTRESAKATVSLTVSGIDTSSHTVHLRYREKDATPEATWMNASDQTASSGSAEFTLSSLHAATIYEVQAWLDNDPEPADSETYDFYTLAEVATVTVSDEGQTTAKATATLDIASGDDSTKTVHLRYRTNGTPPGSWVTFTPSKTTTTDSVEFSLMGLKSDTDYRVEAWTEDDFDNVTAPSDTFKTLRPTVSKVDVKDADIRQESATATVTIQAPNGEDQTVYLRYRPSTQEGWDTAASDAGEITNGSSTSTASIPISGLKSDTLYEVEASLETDYSQSDTASFTTNAPTLTEITVSEVMQQSAKATITIRAHNGQSQMIYVRLRKVTNPVNTDWTDAVDTTSTTDTANTPLSNLTSGTEYEAQASLKDNFPRTAGVTVTSEPFTTEGPSLTGLTEIEVSLNGARLKAAIQAPNDESQTIYYRYRPTSQSDWSTTATDAGSSSTTSQANSESANIELASLNSSTSYEVEASLSSDLDSPTSDVVSAAITTLTPDPSISKVIISEEKQTTAKATVTIANPGTSGNTVHLRHRETGTATWSSPALTGSTTGSETEVEVTIAGLTAAKSYEAQLSLASDFSNSTIIPFSTIPYPSVESVAVTDIGRTTAKVTVSINDEDGVSREVHLRYIVKSDTLDWTNDGMTTKTDDNGTDTATKDLENLSSGTTYILQASYDTNFIAGVEEAEFTTHHIPSIGSVTADTITKTTARAVVDIAHHDDAELTVELRYQVKAETQDWTTNVTTAQAVSSENPVTKVLASLTAGTEYVLQASFDSTFPDGATKEYTFTTKNLPSILSVSVGNEGHTSARATIIIANSDGSTQTAKLQFRTTSPQGQWSTPPLEGSSTNATASISISGLTASTSYEVQAWLVTDESNKVTDTFRTQSVPQPPPNNNPPENNDPPPQRSPITPPPSVSDVNFSNITQTAADATVSLSNAGNSQKTVRLRYREDGTTRWTSVPAKKTNGASTTISLTDLTAGTTYDVQAWLTTNSPPSSTQIHEFTTLDEVVPEPSISSLECENIGQTFATAMVKIANAGTDMKEIYLKHSLDGLDSWTMLPSPSITYTDSTSINLTGLQVGTTYEVAVALTNDFNGMLTCSFTTLSPDPSVSGIGISDITNTSAVATVSIASPGTSQKTVHLRYRVFGETEWGTAQTETTSGSSAQFDLEGLSQRTTYEVEASLSSDFSGSKTAKFTTLVPDPSVSSVTIGTIRQTSAVATISIADAGQAQKTVHLRYRVEGTEEWSDPALSTTTYGASATMDLAGLTADTDYEVQVSLEGSFAAFASTVFKTLRYPSLSDIDVTDISKTTATAEISIADPDGSGQMVHLRYRTTTPQGNWSSTQTTTSTTADASIKLTGLVTDTEYEVQASLTSAFTVSVTDTFTTLPPDPVVSKVNVIRIMQTTATAKIDIANSDGSSQTVSLRYRTTTPRGDWSGTLTTTSSTDSASIDLAGLTPGTEYDVHASLDGTFPAARTKYDTFTTLRYPSIASLEAENIGRNGATVSANIADSQGESQTVYVRHRQSRYITWRTTQQTDSVDDIANLRLRGLSSGTEYIADASLDSSFPSDGTKSVTFTTKERKDDDDAVVVQEARSVNAPLPGFSPQMLRFVAVEGGVSPAPQTFSVWNRAQGTMEFILSNQQEWLSQEPTSGTSGGPADSVTITASVDSSELASGHYVDIISIDVSASGKSPDQVIVVLDVLPPDYVRQFVSRNEGGTVILPDGTVKIVVQPLSPPKDVDIELMKLNLQAHGAPPGDQQRVVVAIESNTYEPGGDTPEDVAYLPYVTLWVMLPDGEEAACAEGRVRVYSVQGDWSLVEHSCETDESGSVWAVADVERLGAFALVIDDSPTTPTPTPAAAAMATPTGSVIGSASSATVRTSLPAMPPTPVPTAVPTVVPAPVGQATAALEPETMPTPTATAVPATVEPSVSGMQATADVGRSGGMSGVILAAIGLSMLLGAMLIGYLIYRKRRRRNGAEL